MSDQANKLQRLLALALNESAADGEAMNALRAARKIVKELGGIDKCIKVSEPAKQHANGNPFMGGGFGFWQGFDPGANPFVDAAARAKRESERIRKQQEAKERNE